MAAKVVITEESAFVACSFCTRVALLAGPPPRPDWITLCERCRVLLHAPEAGEGDEVRYVVENGGRNA